MFAGAREAHAAAPAACSAVSEAVHATSKAAEPGRQVSAVGGRRRARRRAAVPGPGNTAADAPPRRRRRPVVPNDDEIDGSTTHLAQLRTHEAAIMAASRAHEGRAQGADDAYQRAREARDHKKAVIAEDNAKLGRFQRGCAKLKPRPTKEEARRAGQVPAEGGARGRRVRPRPPAPPPPGGRSRRRPPASARRSAGSSSTSCGRRCSRASAR